MPKGLAVLTLSLVVLFAAPVLPVFAAGAGGFSNPAPHTAEETRRAALYRHGVSAYHAGDYGRAVRLFTKVVVEDPDNVDGLAYLGRTLSQMNAPDKAMKAYRRALMIDPEHRTAHEFLGLLFLDRKEPGKAQKLLARLEKFCPFGCAQERLLRQAIKDYAALVPVGGVAPVEPTQQSGPGQ